MFPSVDELQSALVGSSADAFFDEHLRGKHSGRFGPNQISYAAEVLESHYQVAVDPNDLIVVGSAKVGFALHEKRYEGQIVAPAFRPYTPESDIDLSVCSPTLFNLLWHELSSYLCQFDYFPHRQRKLGDYLAYGWLRIDQLPKEPDARLTKCRRLLAARGEIRRNRQRGNPMVNLGIFYDMEHLRLYQVRSIEICRRRLENPL